MKILLHIGQSKTGTSAIQAFLTLNRKKLRSTGVLYPNVRIGGSTIDLSSHNALADSLVGHFRYPHLTAEQYFRQFFEEAEQTGAKRLLLSAEHFFGGEPRIWNVPNETIYLDLYREKIETLAQHLKGHEVTILVYLRPQVDWLASAIGQTIRIERLISEKRIYKNDHQFFEMAKPVLRYCDLLDIWNEVLSPVSITAVPYSRDTLYQNNSIADFLHRAELDHLEYPESLMHLNVNESLSREYLEVKKLINNKPKTKNQERIAISCLERLSRKSEFDTSYRISNDLIAAVEGYVEKQNTGLNEKYTKNSQPLKARISYTGNNLMPVSNGDIYKAMIAFQKEYHRPRTHFLSLQYRILAFLRKHAKPVHSTLHQFRRLHWKMIYR